ncbi:Cobalt-precorrin-5B C(1)-methyltransferase [Bacteroides pyogenes]|uniref:cobalt-precorrin-5B (C(1))-methyltransferase CbiD n=1 Tax=Bacteroides pyogenes TaxID=310300 RepID=UPI001BA5C25E|nr:cobalt-precorrin-5B (C(1))-methyltransferase CbiD [Bacteroides pyogenes]MBR8719778.1 Cobalt-precorrin-5B C(1)-methyltransferase [Bacteroides pyogenes]MBR8786798.1 Cobalt-precorrin-5B C(1)-methyltransferase [Bacteroides pyogenes]MBR8792283.1 Cobalt-precorrin-5B C(1)-methyltransferase [Bacteroides pyogenes]
MILIFGGTTEGRIAAETVDEAGQPFFYSTRGTLQEVEGRNMVRLTGEMNRKEITSFCREHRIRLIVDAAHPFAAQLHANIDGAAKDTAIQVVRLERLYPQLPGDIIRCESFDEAILRMKRDGIKKLLALTGTQTIGKLKPFWQENDCIFRILRREESVETALREGFPKEKLVFYQPEENEEKILEETNPQAIITKESGRSGGFVEKIEAAAKAGVKIYVVKRPPMPESFITVTGKHGLRRTIEQHVPGFYPLRSGLTTGTCATAASKAAALALIDEVFEKETEVTLPDGERISVAIDRVEKTDAQTARAEVVKDAGDDPDVTHGHRIISTVSFSDEPGIHFLQGKGVGRVTLPGLGLPVGEPAINVTPRNMIAGELTAIYGGGLDVTISVPDGEELAKRTFNPKLGIVGGISIIGTSGIVRPFSSEAFVDAIRREVEVAKAVGAERLVINSGAKSEKHVKAIYPDLPPQAFVHYGNFIGETLKIAEDTGFQKVSMGIMIGKAVKLAEGHLDTHSKKVVMNKEFLRKTALEARCSSATMDLIRDMTLARELWNIPVPEEKDSFFNKIVALCTRHCQSILPHAELTLLLIDEDGKVFNKKVSSQ